MTPRDLKDFRERVPDCELAVYADLASETVLSSDGALHFPQEYLDAIRDTATQIFAGVQDGRFARTDHVVFLGPSGGRAFVRDMAEPDEVLCCIIGPDTDSRHLLAEARSALQRAGQNR